MTVNAKGYCTGGRTVVDTVDRVPCPTCGVIRKPLVETRNGEMVYIFTSHRPPTPGAVLAQAAPAQTKADTLDAEAARLVEAGASGQAFDELHRRGWKPLSQREDHGLQPCPTDCGVCHPVFSPVRRRQR